MLGDSSKEKSVASPSKERKTLTMNNDNDIKKTIQSTTTTPPSTTGSATPSSSTTLTPKKWTGTSAESKPKPNTTASNELVTEQLQRKKGEIHIYIPVCVRALNLWMS